MNSTNKSAGLCLHCGEELKNKIRCEFCRRRQNWTGSVKEPSWWPDSLRTLDRGTARNMRWIDYVLSACVVFVLVSVGIGTTVASRISGSPKSGISVPNMVGMNLQSAQDCLQAEGFKNLNFETGGWHLWDRNYKVTRQVPLEVESMTDEVTLYAIKGKYAGDYGRDDCP